MLTSLSFLHLLTKQTFVDNLEVCTVNVQCLAVNHQFSGLRQSLTDFPEHFLTRICTNRHTKLRLNYDNHRLTKGILVVVDKTSNAGVFAKLTTAIAVDFANVFQTKINFLLHAIFRKDNRVATSNHLLAVNSNGNNRGQGICSNRTATAVITALRNLVAGNADSFTSSNHVQITAVVVKLSTIGDASKVASQVIYSALKKSTTSQRHGQGYDCYHHSKDSDDVVFLHLCCSSTFFFLMLDAILNSIRGIHLQL